jgi:hypothetical protein
MTEGKFGELRTARVVHRWRFVHSGPSVNCFLQAHPGGCVSCQPDLVSEPVDQPVRHGIDR